MKIGVFQDSWTQLYALDPEAALRGGVGVGAVDVDRPGRAQIATTPGPGGGPHVRPFRFDTRTGTATPVAGGFFAYDATFTGGASIGAE